MMIDDTLRQCSILSSAVQYMLVVSYVPVPVLITSPFCMYVFRDCCRESVLCACAVLSVSVVAVLQYSISAS